MAITVSFQKMKVWKHDTYEGLSDVISAIEWIFVLTDTDTGDHRKMGGVLKIDLTNASDGFTPIADVTDEMLEQWVRDDLGDLFQEMYDHALASLQEGPTPKIETDSELADMTVYFEAS